MSSSKQGGPLSGQFLLGVYVPSALILTGCLALRRDLLPVAVAVIAGLAGYQIYDSQLRSVLNKNFQSFKLKEKVVLSHNTAIYRFQLPTGGSNLGLPIGQHISVRAKVNGSDVTRSYTPITSDNDRGHFDLLVKSYPTGNISKHMGEMKVGQKLQFAGPKGAMVYTPNMVRHLGMIAGGTGITPMWQIITAILNNRPSNGGNDKTEIDLIFANVNPEDILMKKELEDLAARDSGFRLHYVLNNPPEGWKGGVGFVTPEIIKSAFPPPADDTKILICGPPPMVKAMKNATEGLGYQKAGLVSKLPDQVFCF